MSGRGPRVYKQSKLQSVQWILHVSRVVTSGHSGRQPTSSLRVQAPSDKAPYIKIIHLFLAIRTLPKDSIAVEPVYSGHCARQPCPCYRHLV